MRLKEGSSARIVLQSALMTSYKSPMWHGGVEELLHTVVVPGMDESQRLTMVGGVALRVWEREAGRDSKLAAMDCWDAVEDVRSDPAKFVLVTLLTTSKGACKNGANSEGYILQFKYVISLTAAALSCAVVTANVGSNAISLHGSLQTSVAVNFVDGVYALGLQGYKFLSTPPPNSIPGLLSLSSEKFSVNDTRIGGAFSRFGNDKRNIAGLTLRKTLLWRRRTWSGRRAGSTDFAQCHRIIYLYLTGAKDEESTATILLTKILDFPIRVKNQGLRIGILL